MHYLIIMLSASLVLGCVSSEDYTGTQEASHLVNQCFKLKKPAFIFEGRCADLTGFNSNSELCNGIQIAGAGGFPVNWERYLSIRELFDEKTFDRLAFEKQRTMLVYVKKGSEVIISKVVRHRWGTSGRYWVARGNIAVNGDTLEVELPSFAYVHHDPFWLNGRAKTVPKLNDKYVESCDM